MRYLEKLSCRLEPKLTQDVWMLLHGLLSLVYHAGINTGSERRVTEMQEALGYLADNDQKKV